MIAAARCPARKEPANSQFALPMAQGLIKFDSIVMCLAKARLIDRCKFDPANSRSGRKHKGGPGGNKWAEAFFEKASKEVSGPCGPQRE